MELILIRETWSHMGRTSGFDPLFSQFALLFEKESVSLFANHYEHVKTSKWKKILLNKPKSISLAGRLSPYIEIKHERLANDVVRIMKNRPQAIVMLSVTENQFAPTLASLPDDQLQRLVLFVHQPPAWFKLNWLNTSIFSKVKAIVCLSSNQASYFKTFCSNTLIIQIKHGVNLNFFKPSDIAKNYSGRFVFVGQWMRDFDVLMQSFKIIASQHPDISLHCVIQRRFRNHPALYQLAQLEQVHWYDDVSSEQLLALYQSSDALFLPLIDSTANNALNEAISCGLPVITSKVGGIPDYIQSDTTLLAEPGNVTSHVQACFEFIKNNSDYTGKQLLIRQFAEDTLSWLKQAKYIINQINK